MHRIYSQFKNIKFFKSIGVGCGPNYLDGDGDCYLDNDDSEVTDETAFFEDFDFEVLYDYKKGCGDSGVISGDGWTNLMYLFFEAVV